MANKFVLSNNTNNNLNFLTNDSNIIVIDKKNLLNVLNEGYTVFYVDISRKFFIQKNFPRNKIHIYSNESSHIFIDEKTFVNLYVINVDSNNKIIFYLYKKDSDVDIDPQKDEEFYRWKQ